MTLDRNGDGGNAGIRSLERGLALLRAVNADPHASVRDLSERIGVPRSTAYRLLATLQQQGYLTPLDAAGGYRLRHAVRSLSDGYRDDEWLEEAWPEVVAFGEHVFWPISLFTCEAATMVIRRSTHERSAMSIDYGMTGRRMPLTQTAAGRAYLAFCPTRERRWLLDQPLILQQITSQIDRAVLKRQLMEAYRAGYSSRIGGVMPKTSSISVPVMAGSRVLCCISVIWIASALSFERAIDDLADPLKQVATSIEDIARRVMSNPNSRA